MEKTKINKIRNEKGVTTDIIEIQRIIRNYYNNFTPQKWTTEKENNVSDAVDCETLRI